MQTSTAAAQTRSALKRETLGSASNRLRELQNTIEHAAHLLPAQGPITVFVHHNTLHAFEDLPFEKAVLQGRETFGCQPYLSEERYRQMLSRDRVRLKDLEAVLHLDSGTEAHQSIAGLADRLQLRLAMLQYPLRSGSDAELRWLVAETDALRTFRHDTPPRVREQLLEQTRHWILRDLRNGTGNGHTPQQSPATRHAKEGLTELLERYGKEKIEYWSPAAWEAVTLHALWRACRRGVHGLPQKETKPSSLRHRDALRGATGVDSDLLVNELLIRFCAAFLDQGLAASPLPHREEGFYRAFLRMYGQTGGPPTGWMKTLRRELRRMDQAGLSPLESIDESLRLLGIQEAEHEAFLSQTLLALRGWAGMIWQMETRGDRVPYPAPQGSLVEYLAIRLIVERVVLTTLAKETLGKVVPLSELRQTARHHASQQPAASTDQRAFLVFQIAQIVGWTPERLFALSKSDWTSLLEEIEAFSELERRRAFHLAYERRYRIQTLDAFSVHCREKPTSPSRPRAQVICCIDEREESFRRHLEEVTPDVETAGTAGFFGVAMYYRGVAEAHFTPLCPIVVKPQHWVVERVAYPFEEEHRRRSRMRRFLAGLGHRLHVGSRTLAGGALTALMGSLATAPLVARVLFPRLTARIRQMAGRLVQPSPITQLQLERTESTAGPKSRQIGFSLEEMAAIVGQLLRDTGLASRLARLVMMTGHGSASLNNPHEAAHDCGACAGARGGPNARAFAQMGNDLRVRAILAEGGLTIPDDTVFVGAYHNTCDDSVAYFDLDRLPDSHRDEFETIKRSMNLARERSAHERCRRFESAILSLSTEGGLRHVEARAEDLAQTRPEYGHATNALTFVGRRSRTRGLFLDRRAFLTSYDPTQDDEEHSILMRNLQAVVPVCAGIALEYYFSFTDPTGYGCGTKLPHNITSLLGVMDGAASDLRTGLPWQMVEIHEPMRQLFIVETTPEAMQHIMERNPDIGRLCRNRWVQLATLDPASPTIHLYDGEQFHLYEPETTHLPQVAASVDWYRGWRDHLGFAVIQSPSPREGGAVAAQKLAESRDS